MVRLFRLLAVAMVAAAVVAAGVDAAPSGRRPAATAATAAATAADAVALPTRSGRTADWGGGLCSVNGTTPAWQLADAHGCKPMSSCLSLQSHLASRYGANGTCLSSHLYMATTVLNRLNATLDTIIAVNCCATHMQLAVLTRMSKLLVNMDACAMNDTVPEQYVSPYNFQTTPIFAGMTTSMLTTSSRLTSSSSMLTTSAPSVRQGRAESDARRAAPAAEVQLQAGAKDLELDLGQCCLPYFEFINQNQEHTCCTEECWHMVDMLGLYFTMEECCADGGNQAGTYIECP